MARRRKPVPGSRGERVQKIKEAVERKEGTDLTVDDIADRLNAIAHALGFAGVWSGPRFSKIVHGQEPSLEDAACLIELDPENRTWDWLAIGDVSRPVARGKFRKER